MDRMRLAPANAFPSTEIRQAELRIDFERSRLRVMEDIARKFDPDQSRVPAGSPDGGQWTNTGGRSYAPVSRATPSRARLLPGGQPPAPARPGRTPPVKAPSSGSWMGGAMRALRPLVRRIPGAATLAEIIDRMDWSDDVESRIREYNSLVTDIGPDTRFLPIISARARARSYELARDGANVAVAALSREEVIKQCPNYLRVRQWLNEATKEAGPVSNFRSIADRGKRIHYLVEGKVNKLGDPNLLAERSLLKSRQAASADIRPGERRDPWVIRGLEDSLRVDVFDKVPNLPLACVYDPKTGDNEITFGRLDEIGKTVARNFGPGTKFFVVGMRPFE